jgi:hypothetical protein
MREVLIADQIHAEMRREQRETDAHYNTESTKNHE